MVIKLEKRVIIVGTGGHAKVVYDIVKSAGDRVYGFLTTDDISEFLGIPVLGKNEDFIRYPDCYFIIAIGNQNVRCRLAQQMDGVRWYTAIHPTAVISKVGTVIGEGTAVMPNAVINANAKIGKHCIINTNAAVEHDDVIADFSHISVGTKLSGTVHIGERTWVGAGATVIQETKICADCMIGAGAVVVKDISVPDTYIGVPAKRKCEK